ncbi:MAG: helix-turn-helix domain-containing protein [Actinomycetota bacterium]
MEAARVLRSARKRAGLTQRGLAERAGVAQPVVARIESGKADPRVRTLSKLLRACGSEIQEVPRRGIGIDRTLIHQMLAMAPDLRFKYAIESSINAHSMVRSMKEIK